MVTLKIIIGLAAAILALGCIAWFVPSDVVVSRAFAAPLEKLWALWAKPDAIKQWWGPKGYTAPVVQSDLTSGGSYLLVMRSGDGAESRNTGTYLEVVPMKRIVQSMSFADASGHPVPGASVPLPGRWPDQITVTTEFAASETGTEVRIREEGIPLIIKVFATLGWRQQFDKIEALLR